MPENVVLIYGNGDQRSSYPKLVSRIESSGRTVLPLSMDWSITDPNDPEQGPRNWANQVAEQIGDQPFGTILGHSYGAVTGLVYAADLARRAEPPQPFPQVILASQSSRYRSDIYGKHGLEVVSYIKGMHDNRVPRGFRENRITPLVDAVLTQLPSEEVTVFVGGQEVKRIPQILRRAKSTAKLFGTQAHIVPGAPHNIEESEEYISAVVDQVVKR